MKTAFQSTNQHLHRYTHSPLWALAFAALLGPFLITAQSVAGADSGSRIFKNDNVAYFGTRDTHIRLDMPDVNTAANAAVQVDSTNPLTQGLLQFDDIFGNGSNQVPPGARITSARLLLRTINEGDSPRFHRMLATWNDTTVTWNSIANGIDTNGVETTTDADAIMLPRPDLAGVTRTVDITTSVQAWSDNAPNHGWAILPGGGNSYQFASSEDATISNRPCLIVDYVVIESPPRIEMEPPTKQILKEGDPVTIIAHVSGPSVQLQWCKNGTNLPGATSPYIILAAALPHHNGTYVLKAVNGFGSTNTRSSELCVLADTNAPALVSAFGSTNLETILLGFSEIIAPTTAENVANYTVQAIGGQAHSVSSAVLTNATNVLLTVTPPRVFGTNYQVTVAGVTDFSAAMNPIQPGSNSLAIVSEVILIAWNSVWAWATNNLDGIPWQTVGYNSSSWSNGPGLFGFEASGPIQSSIRTYISPALQTFYLRLFEPVWFPYDTAEVAFKMDFYADDAFALYNNGCERLRYWFLARVVANGTPARSNSPEAIQTTNLTLVPGSNQLAVETHNSILPSSDLVFGCQITARVPYFHLPVPRLYACQCANGDLAISWGGSDHVLMCSDDPAGPWMRVMAPGVITSGPYVKAGLHGSKFYTLFPGP